MKLSKFLEINDFIPRNQAFVDDYQLKAYDAVGFKSLGKDYDPPKDFKLTNPFDKMGDWWKYLSNVMKVSPTDKETAMDAVAKLGGTFVVDGPDVVYQWNDVIPGDTPDLDKVMKLIRNDQ